MSFIPDGRRLVADWRAFAAPSYRAFHGVALGQAFVGSLTGPAILVPLLLALGTHPALVTVITALPLLGSMLQIAMPKLLARTDGNLAGITRLCIKLGELRGLWLALIVILAAAGVVSINAAIILLAIVISICQTLGGLSAANLQLWYSAVLTRPGERRLVQPKISVVVLALSTLVLLPTAAVVDLLSPAFGIAGYAPLLIAAGLAGLLILYSTHRLPDPGEVLVRLDRSAPLESDEMVRFRRVTTLSNLAAGLMPFISIYLISVLHTSSGFSIAVAALGSASSVAAAIIAGSFLARGSASRLFRASMLARGLATVLLVLSFPGNPFAVGFVCAAVLALNAAATTEGLASNERFFRLADSDAIVAQQARLVTHNAGAAAGGQILSAAALVVLPVAYPAFAALFGAVAALRVGAAWQAEVGPSWITAPEPELSEAG